MFETRIHYLNIGLISVVCVWQTITVCAALVGHQLGGTAILLGHCGLEWNHANSKTLLVNQDKEFALLNHKQDSYFHIDDVLCFVDEDSYDADCIVSKRTQAEESSG